MSIFERIQELAIARDKSLQTVAVELGFSKNLFYRWQNSAPKATDLEKVADYFHVSVDFLLGRTAITQPVTASSDNYEEELLLLFRKGEADVPTEQRAIYRKQVADLMGFISKTMQDLDSTKE